MTKKNREIESQNLLWSWFHGKIFEIPQKLLSIWFDKKFVKLSYKTYHSVEKSSKKRSCWKIFRQINLTVKLFTTHSVEKYTKTLSLWKIFREITQQKFAKFAFTNAWFSILRGCFWVMWTKYDLKNTIFSWIYTKQKQFLK